ncbi:MAG: signal recognition particle protein, partial [Paucibacter sp.]|nr:signal recognition particle protein [Roseateles sp.]
YRPAAIEQLKTVTKQAGAEWFPSSPDQKPRDIALAAIDYAKKHYFDVLLVDTAGRLAIDEALMAEIRDLHALLNPIETLFVVDAMQGQDAINTAKAFKEALPLTGIVLTKLDGDSRGGAALSVRQITGAPIKFAGTSEKIDGLEVFDAERHAGRVLGMGGLAGLMDKLPSQMTAKTGAADMDRAEKDMRRMEGIMNAMTAKERRQPALLLEGKSKASRKRRIASGAGVQIHEVNRVLTQFDQMQGMMKKMSGGGMMKMMKKMGGMKGMKGMMGG